MPKKSFDSPQKTKKFAADLAGKLTKRRGRRALILALSGDLGSGKTTFVQGFLAGLGVKSKTTSPTFVLFKRFKIKNPRFKNAYHVDCYRIKKPGDFLRLGFREILNSSQNIVLIEWAEKIKSILPKNAIWLKFQHGKKENERGLSF